MALRWSKNRAGNYAYACTRVKSRKTFLLGKETYLREGNDLISGGLYLDMPPWGYHLLDLQQWM